MKFDEVKKGYKKEQVDEYLATVSAEYQSLFEKHEALEAKMKENSAQSEAIAATLIQAEISSKRIIAGAKIEAKMIINQQSKEVDALENQKEETIEELTAIAERIEHIVNQTSFAKEKEGEKLDGKKP